MAHNSKMTEMVSGYCAAEPRDYGDCYWYGPPTVGEAIHVETLQEVDSVRRIKPKKPWRPNNFKVHKFFAGYNVDDWASVCYLPSTRSIVTTQNRCCKKTLLKSQPQELCDVYKLVTDNAVRDCYAKANSPRIFDAAPMLFELGETLLYLKFLFKGMLKLTDPSTYRRLLQPESLWLEYRYAIMPLILTISDVMEAFEGGSDVLTYDSRIELDAISHVYKDPNWLYQGGINPDGLYDVRNSVKDRVSATCRLYVRTQCDPSPLGVGLWDMLRGSWEIVPLSFVIDWFYGVGDWLTSVRETELELTDSYVTTVVNREGSIKSKDSTYMRWTKDVDWEYNEFMMERKTGVVPPTLPLLQVEKLSMLRTVDAISLIVSFMKGILSRKK